MTRTTTGDRTLMAHRRVSWELSPEFDRSAKHLWTVHGKIPSAPAQRPGAPPPAPLSWSCGGWVDKSAVGKEAVGRSATVEQGEAASSKAERSHMCSSYDKPEVGLWCRERSQLKPGSTPSCSPAFPFYALSLSLSFVCHHTGNYETLARKCLLPFNMPHY